MKCAVLGAALLAAAAINVAPAAAASGGSCYTPAALEAEQAIRFMTDVMVVSSACKNTVYAEFRLRNRDAIIRYQNALIAHFHGQRVFDSWNTTLANESSMRQSTVPTAQLCVQAGDMLKQASLLDTKGFHDFAVAKAATMSASYAKCGK
jgi:hypothetical protein